MAAGSGCGVGVSRGRDPRLSWTRMLLLALILAASARRPLPAAAELDVLDHMELMEVGGDSGQVGGAGGNLEASMTSSLLRDYLEVTEGVAAVGRRQGAALAAFPDSSAVVGRIFTLKLPKEAELQQGDTVMGSEVGASSSLPSWLHLDPTLHLLQGLPLEEDKGVHYISVSTSNRSSTQVFSIEVHPEDHLDADSAPPTTAAGEDELQAFSCPNEEPVTVLTVILDADLTKMNSTQRVELLERMRTFSRVELQHMKILPVVNNRLFDMSAFMAGPGNAKKVVENGALLSWKLGCSLDQTSIPDIRSVQGPAREGAMSARLGYPVVGWHIANKRPHVPKRVRRQLNNTPTPVLAVLPPTTTVEPPGRVVPTLSSPSIAGPSDSSAPPVRGPVPLPGKPTIRVRDPIGHTPTVRPPQPTAVMETTSILHIQPTVSRPSYPEATATPPLTTRSPGKKTKRIKTTSASKGPKASTPAPPIRTTPAPPIRTTPAPAPPAIPVPPVVPDPYNEKPVLRNPIDQVSAMVGTYFEVKIPSDTFFDKEDGTTDKLRLTLRHNHKEVVGDDSWIQFNSTSQLLYGLADVQHVGKHEYFMQATDKGGLNAIDAFEVRVGRWPANDKTPVIFTVRLEGEPRSVTADIHKKILLVKRLAAALGDRNSSTVSLRNITKGSVVVAWTNSSLPHHPCPKEQLAVMSRALADAQGRPSPTLRSHLEPEFRPLDVTVRGRASCQAFSFIPPGELDVPEPAAVTPGVGSSRDSADDVYLHTVIPAVVVAAILLTAGIIAMICYRKKRKGKLTIEDQATFIKKGVPIIFADELDDSKPPPSSSMPLILQEEKPPLPPPEYPSMASPETTPLNQELLGEYTALRDEDPNAPPYQPPPPFTTPMEGKGSRPKNMTPYRSPPPYVPP